MTIWEATAERNALRAEGRDAIAVETIRWDGLRTSLVLNGEAELENFRALNKDWDVTINVLA